jgi:23S rRNA (cytosine1962-C5)-methyltransferase
LEQIAMITLKKNSDRRIRKGHLWVFSNEIAQPPVSELEPGSVHDLVDATGEFIAMVYANPNSLIAGRILSRRKVEIDGAFISDRIQQAVQQRKRLFPTRESYRLVYGEADLMPGLVVDRYGSVLAVQCLTAGMDRLLDLVVEALVEELNPEGIYLRNDSPMRSLEGLPLEQKVLHGAVPETVTIDSWGLTFRVDIPNGQKTGYFLDQESNRPLMKQYVTPGSKVLDLFCYTAAWGIHAAAAGAAEVTAVDSSRGALAMAASNAELNGFQERVITVKDSAIDFLKKTHESWDVVVVDPPAFIKSRAAVKEGQKGYIDVNRRALNKLNRGGILVTCSCSHHLPLSLLEESLLSASRQSGKELRILDIRGQSPDHPALLSMPETRYLKVIVAQAF